MCPKLIELLSWNGPTVHVCCFMLARAYTKTFVSRIRIRQPSPKTAKTTFVSRKISQHGHSLSEVSLYVEADRCLFGSYNGQCGRRVTEWFEVTPLLHSYSFIRTDDRGSKTFRNVTTLRPNCTASHLQKTTLFLVISDNLNCQKNADVCQLCVICRLYSLPLIGFVLKLLKEISNCNRRNPVVCNFIYQRIIQ